MTSRDYDITLVMLQSSKLSRSKIRTQVDYPCGLFKQTVS